jgi:hypothetical protein
LVDLSVSLIEQGLNLREWSMSWSVRLTHGVRLPRHRRPASQSARFVAFNSIDNIRGWRLALRCWGIGRKS